VVKCGDGGVASVAGNRRAGPEGRSCEDRRRRGGEGQRGAVGGGISEGRWADVRRKKKPSRGSHARRKTSRWLLAIPTTRDSRAVG
jgi:hypothetical protein